MYNWKDFTPTNNTVVDMCAAIILEHRVKMLPIKAIHLRPVHYFEFESWLKKQIQRDLDKDEKMEFDGVYIEKGDNRQASRFLVELWTSADSVRKSLIEHGKPFGVS